MRLIGFTWQAMGAPHNSLDMDILFADRLQIFDDAVALLDFNLLGPGPECLHRFVPIALILYSPFATRSASARSTSWSLFKSVTKASGKTNDSGS